jgi:hypothetical protein
VYQFFHYKEELRTAKISTLVIVLAFVCWTPFFVQIAAVSVHVAGVTLWLHHAASVLAVAFAAITPYVYVFR